MSAKTIAEMTAEIREVNVAKGWRPAEGGPGDNTWGDYIALLHSEVSEALESYRDHRLADATEPACEVTRSLVVDDICTTHQRHASRCQVPPKPEGVGSELADVLIRLLDMGDVFGIGVSGYERLVDIREGHTLMPVRSFGDHMAWLHGEITVAWGRREHIAYVLRALLTVARYYEIDLDAEYERKIAYNRTRAFQHGGRTVAEPERPITLATGDRLNALLCTMPTDPRDWWTSDEVAEFINEWRRLGMPELKTQDAQGSTLLLWCTDVRRAAEMIGIGDHVTNDESFSIKRGEYEVGIVQAAIKKETKDA